MEGGELTEWLVIRYRFNENTLLWEYDDTMVFGSDELLLKYLREQSHTASNYRHEITRLMRAVQGENP